MHGRVIDSGISDPAFVMALDEVFLDRVSSEPESSPVLHFYRKTPSISLGYFQSIEDAVDLEACRDLGVGIFRRKSGGGTIFEDEGQLIYGLTIPRPVELGIPKVTLDSFRHLNSAIISVLEDLGYPAHYVPVNDILIHGRKVSGCAQTRKRGALLQHGTLIVRYDPDVMFRVLRSSPDKLREKGLKDPRDRVTSLEREIPPGFNFSDISMEKIIDLMTHHMSSLLGINFESDVLTDQESAAAHKLAEEKYRSHEWTHRR